MREPLLQQEAGNPKKGVTGDVHSEHYIARQWRRMTTYFANHPPTVGYMLFLSLVFGVSSGVVAFIYDTYFEAILKLVWEVRHLSRLSTHNEEGPNANESSSVREALAESSSAAPLSFSHCRAHLVPAKVREAQQSMQKTMTWVTIVLKALHLLCILQIIPEQGITPLFNHLNSSTSWFPALGKV